MAFLTAAGTGLWTVVSDRATDALTVTTVSVPRPEPSPAFTRHRSPSPSARVSASPSADVLPTRAPRSAAGAAQVSFPPGDQWVFDHALPAGAAASLYHAYGSPEQARSTNSVDTERLDAWATREGGYNVAATEVRVVLAAHNRPVEVVALRAHVIERRSIPATTVVYVPPQGADDTVRVDLRLDQAQPAAGYFADHHLNLGPNESETLDVRAEALESAVVWDLVLDVVADGELTRTVVTRADGRHFRTSGWADGRHHRTGPAGVDDSPAPWQRYRQAFVFDLTAQTYDQQGGLLRQDPAKVWRRCTGPGLLDGAVRPCLAGP
ncbi:hypothetical protein [Nucisporomicrobium flavum]|uniref:hypothetical protein n=1 Tax=Nucisporomicrobium flavum TaxID=2785915 RepID=UPI0018F295AC|nr:hypothetical protein [Nucisporomicrobium flavum]